jgi:hypothetical protein
MSLTIHRRKSWRSRAGDRMNDIDLKAAADAAKHAGKVANLPAVAKAGKTVAERTPKKGWPAVLAGGLGLAGAIIAMVLATRKRDAAAPE